MRVYEREDYERAIELVSELAGPLDSLITSRRPLSALPEVFAALTSGGEEVKVLIDIRGE